MNKTVMLKKMVDTYNKFAFTHNYIFGYEDRGIIYCTITKSDVLPFVCTIDIASRNGGCSLRFKPNKDQKDLLKTYETFTLCSKEYFETLVEKSKYNRGEIFEKMVTEFYGQEWEKDNVPFTDAGDLEVDGVAYQIKFQKATFASEKSLARLG